MRVGKPLAEIVFPALRGSIHILLRVGEDSGNLALFLLYLSGGEQVRVGGVEGGGAFDIGFGDKLMAVHRRLLRQ
ncbi:hypothetical protein D3C75_1224200 [compost metagenome]